MRELPDLESSTEEYANRFAGAVGEYLLEVQTRAILDLARPWFGSTVLDVGGGHAQLCRPLLDSGCRVALLGSEAVCFARAQRLFGTRIQYLEGDLTDPPAADQSFDVVIAIRMLAHIRDDGRFVTGLCRVARHAVIVDYPAAWSVNAATPLLFGLKKVVEGDTRQYRRYRTGRLTALFRENGFHSFRTSRQFFWPMVLHRALNRPRLSRVLEWAPATGQLTRLLGSPVCLRAIRA
jgi:2-polyprenyl-3-methyl-5-hydroxy-6-metoxy-1,4-benzoquinol methylase